ncbi:hypothetical protein Cni_G14660 [Canna indica]|uniref:J domain-containing protein n=1 Tax=Canna indica TaxID=4628 RepID=A0AAQ3KD95_9LILI|nr:hypothetical protein Cni_G14660 [Canna indica]
MASPHAIFSPSQFLGLRLASPPHPSPATASFSPRPTVVAAAAALRSPGASASAPAQSLYEVLRVPAEASSGEIKAAYRRLALECHPDVGAPADEFMRVHAAYSTLSDPNKRADYDRQLMVLEQRRRRQPVYSRSPTFPGSSRRTWETDQCW